MEFISKISCLNFLGCTSYTMEETLASYKKEEDENLDYKKPTNVKMDLDNTFTIRGQKVQVNENFIK